MGSGVESCAGVERRERFVEQQQGRFDSEGPGERDPLRLPAGELPRLVMGQVGEADAVQPMRRGLVGVVAGGAAASGSEGDVLQGGEVGEE